MKKLLLAIIISLCQLVTFGQNTCEIVVEKKDGTTWISNVQDIVRISFKAIKEELDDTPSTEVEAVDLGLSVKWASHNVGASSPEDPGGYYSWGETEEKSDYTWNTYSIGKNDIGDIYGTEYDVAYVKWGKEWRMPTQAEMLELESKCTFEWAKRNGNKGIVVTGPSGNTIFLPAGGAKYSLSEGISGKNEKVKYWSGSHAEYNDAGGSLRIQQLRTGSLSHVRYAGFNVRPVSN